MEDEHGLELSLGLSCGRSSGKSKTVDISSDSDLEAGGRLGTKGSDQSFKNFFQTGSEKQYIKGKQQSDHILPQTENFWTDLRKCSASASASDASPDVHNNVSQFAMYQELWTSKTKTADTEVNPNKRKMPFEEISFQNKHDNLIEYTSASYNNPASINIIRNCQVPNQTEHVSMGENEAIAESETEGSKSWLMYKHEDKSKCSDIPLFTDKHILRDSSGIGSKDQKKSSVSRTKANYASREAAYIVPSSLQPLHGMAVPYPVPVKVATTPNAPNPGFPSPCVMQGMPVVTDDQPSGPALNSSNLQLSFGYSSVQLPTLETGSSWAFNSQPCKVTSLTNKDNAPSSEHFDVKTSEVSVQPPHISSPAVMFRGKSSDLVKINGKHAGEDDTSSKTQDKGMENLSIFTPKETRQPAVEGFLQRESTIMGGIASEIKFGGSGSSPNLPWVSTTGSGPNGKTISGVTYKYNQNQVKIVCACHGIHMSTEEFVQHASSEAPKPEDNATFISNPPAASAKS